MKIRFVFLAALSLVLLGGLACKDDPESPPSAAQPTFEDLSQRWHVINNIEVAYNKRNLSKYEQLVDENFSFVLSPGDVGGGVPEQWWRTEEILLHSRMFDSEYAGLHRVKSIDMHLSMPVDKSDIVWVETAPLSASNETWYTTTIFYKFVIWTEPDTPYESVPGGKVQLTVRNSGTNAEPTWKLVELRDLAERRVAYQTAAPEFSTWGQVKALYLQ